MNLLKKMFVLMIAALSISMVAMTNTKAADDATGGLLAQIAKNTYNTVELLQNTPGYVNGLTKYVISWLAEDTGDTSILMQTQGNFANIGNIFATGTQTNVKNGMQQQIVADLIGAKIDDFKGGPGRKAAIMTDVPQINEIAYSSLVGAPPVQQEEPNIYGYITNAAGLNHPHLYPQNTWEGNGDNKEKYLRYFNTIVAVQSYNAYVLSQIGAGSTATPIQNELIAKVSKPDWLAQIATEELGKVLRQILLFESQNYVLNTQIQQNQQQLVATQAMTNSLLILFNQQQEEGLRKQAMGLSVS